MPMATLGSQMRAVNKASLYYNDWKVLNESSRLTELQRRCPPRGNCQTAICQLSPFIFLSCQRLYQAPVLPRVPRWPQMALGLSCRTGQSEGLLQQQESGILLGFGQQICFQGIVEEHKTWEGSDLPQVAWSHSCSCPWLGCRG